MAAIALRPDYVRANPDPLLVDSIRDGMRAAPRVPAGRDSLAAAAVPVGIRALQRAMAASVKTRFFNALAAIEPWYDWGSTFIERMDEIGEGPGRFAELQWFGINVTLFFGRTPPVGGR